MIDETITELTPLIGVRAACAAVGRPRATHYRHHRKSPAPVRPARPRARQPRALSPTEQARVLEVLHSERFADMAPDEVHAVLAGDEVEAEPGFFEGDTVAHCGPTLPCASGWGETPPLMFFPLHGVRLVGRR